MNMNKAALKDEIIQAIAKLEKEIISLKETTKPISPDVSIGRISRMDAINNKSVAEASLRNAEAKLQGLKNALQNIDSPEFGICVKCRQPIPEGRILLVPEKRLCVKCS